MARRSSSRSFAGGKAARPVSARTDAIAASVCARLLFSRAIAADPEWERLFFEFSAYAARNEDFRQELVTRYRSLRGSVAEAYGRRAERDGIDVPLPVDQIALMTFAMAKGVALEKLLEPDAVDDEVYGTMLMIFFTGLRTLATSQASA